MPVAESQIRSIHGEHGERCEVAGGVRGGIETSGELHRRDARNIRGSTVMHRKKCQGSGAGDALILSGEGDEKVGVVDHYEINGRGRRRSA
jgi:hypothetical protein